jgi:RNA-directed DNA polymerase
MTLEEKIASDLNLTRKYVHLVVRTASHRYKTYEIAKKTGGFRTIHHPARELKLFQRWLMANLLSRLPVHKSAYAYKRGGSIYRNARRHAKSNFLLKVDFRDFFPSILGDDIARLLKTHAALLRNWIVLPSDIETVRRLVCRDDQLSIGAPSSPSLSNLVMFEFDEKWTNYCSQRGVMYSRYADDLYFSTSQPNVLESIFAALKVDLAGRKPAFTINAQKTVFTSRKRKRLVTGLVLTSDRAISLGRQKKRFIKSLVFKYTRHELQPDQITSLKGLLSFVRSVEPSFTDALRRKFGLTILGDLTS